MKYSAVIFDFDGTVLVNEEVYAKAFIEVLRRHNANLKDIDHSHPQEPGIGLKENWVILKERCGIENASVEQLVHETQDVYHSMLDAVKIRPGFYELKQALEEEDIILALATSNDWWLVEDELEDLGLHKQFKTVITGEEVARKKPAPDIFLETARKIGVEPGECVVIEDSKAGVEAAKEAEMVVIAVLSTFTKKEDFPRADWVVEDFSQITPKLLDSFFQN